MSDRPAPQTTSQVDSIEQLRERAFELEFALKKEQALRRENELLLNGLRTLAFASSADQILEQTLERMVASTGAEGAFLLYKRDGIDDLLCEASTASTENLFTGSAWPLGKHFLRALSGQVLPVFDTSQLIEWTAQDPSFVARYASALTVPLRNGNEQALLVCVHSQRAFFSKKVAKTAERMAVLAADGLRLVQDREETLRKRLRQLTSRGEAMRTEMILTAAEAIGEGLLITDENDRLIVCNDAYRKIYDQSAALYQPGCDVIEVFRQEVHSGFVLEAIGQEETWLRSRLANGLNEESSEHSLANGRSVRVSSRKLPNGWTVGMRLDITELKRNETRIAQALEEAERANAAKSRFLATVSHEIRTPLNAVMGMLGVLAQEPLAQQHQNYVGAARTASTRLLDLLNDILDLAKMEAGQIALDDEVILLDDLLGDLERLFQGSLAEKGLSLTVNLARGVPTAVRGDSARVRQILINYISNAIKFTPEGGAIELGVAKSLSSGGADGLGLRFSVRDSGQGITPSDREKLFKPFSQLESTVKSHIGGTGLGLSIVFELAQAMGGVVEVSGEGLTWRDDAGALKQGACFAVDLPLSETAAEAVLTPPEPANALDTLALGELLKGKRLLAADDSTSNLMLLRALFGRFDVVLDCVADGQEALEAMQVADYDLLLMDIAMPVMDGLTACQQLRQIEARQIDGLDGVVATDSVKLAHRGRLPVIALTAAVMAEDRARIDAVGFDGFVAKPIEENSLFATLSALLSTDVAMENLPIVLPDPKGQMAEALASMTDDQRAEMAIALHSEFAQREQALKKSFDDKDLETISLHSHAIKGTGMTFGLRELALAAADIESQAKAALDGDQAARNAAFDWGSLATFIDQLAHTVQGLQP